MPEDYLEIKSPGIKSWELATPICYPFMQVTQHI